MLHPAPKGRHGMDIPSGLPRFSRPELLVVEHGGDSALWSYEFFSCLDQLAFLTCTINEVGTYSLHVSNAVALGILDIDTYI